MNFDLPESTVAFRDEIRTLIAEHVTAATIADQHRTGTFTAPELLRALGTAGAIARVIPGIGSGDAIDLWLLCNELEIAAVPADDLGILMIVATIIAKIGNEHQRTAILPALLSGERRTCLGYSEADAGSDVAAITTRAVRTDGGWIINGAKMWTTMAHIADWVILLTRTDLDVAKHQGLTMFLVPMNTPGITVQPVHTMGTERTNATYYDDVHLGDECVLGEVNGGWAVMAIALAFERGVLGGTNPGVPLLREFHEWAEQSGAINDPRVREHMARIALDNELATLLTQRAAWIAASGGLPGTEGSMAKLFATEAYQKAAQWLQDDAAPHSLLHAHPADYHARHSPVTTIYGGTSEINRNNIALRHLKLPRAPR